MQAVRLHHHGGPEVLRLDTVSRPRPPRGDEVLVRVVASSVNGTDLGLRRGDLPVATWGRLPFTLGFDLAGEVVAGGPTVTAFTPGDRVMGLLGHGGGALAEQVLVRQGRLALAPRTVSAARAAAIPLAGLTALQALQSRAHLPQRPRGTRVLVVGAAGGIGSYAVQLAALMGAHVTATARSSHHDHVRGLGADVVVSARADDLGDRSDGRYGVVLDAAGALTASTAAHLLEPQGCLVSVRPLGWTAITGAVARRLPAGIAAERRRVTSVMTAARSQDLTRLAVLVERGALRVPLDATYSWREAAQAHRHAEQDVRGKVVVLLD